MTTIDRIRRTLDALGPFPARLRRPAGLDVTVLAIIGDEVQVNIEDLEFPFIGRVHPRTVVGLPPEPPVRSPESIRVRELLAEAPRTVAELETALRAEGLSPWAAAPVVSGMSKRREVAVVAVEVVQDARGRHRAVRRWGLTP